MSKSIITKEFVEKNIKEIKKFFPLDELGKEEKTVGIAIKNRWTGTIIFQSTKTTWREAIEEAKTGANLTGADLARADLTGANLTDANLTDANLTDADLTGANLTDADLTGANLTDADLARADLTRANLTGADLARADLTRANLTGADLTGANLTDANLTGADLTDCLFYFGSGNKNFAALCRAIHTIRHPDGEFEDFSPFKKP